MARFRFIISVGVIWLVFVSGYLSRDVLRDWVVQVHSGSLVNQVVEVSLGVLRVFLTLIIFGVGLCSIAFLLLLLVGAVQEIWFQLMHRRKIFRALAALGEHDDDDLEDEEGVAPRRPVSALRHARRAMAAKPVKEEIPISDADKERVERLRHEAVLTKKSDGVNQDDPNAWTVTVKTK